MGGKRWTQEEDIKLKQMVETNQYSYPELIPFFPGRSLSSLQSHGTDALGIYNNHVNSLYTYDKNFFKVPNYINSYFAGILAADGCLSRSNCIVNNYTLIWEMCSKDVQLLELFKKEIKYTGPIPKHKATSFRTGNISEHAGIKLHGINLDDFCLGSNFGVIPNKTHRLGPPPNLKDIELQLAFLRGYLDGDGCICYVDRKNSDQKNISVGFYSSSMAILLWIKNLINNFNLPGIWKGKELNIVKSKESECLRLTYAGRRAIYLFELLSRCPVPCLDRKWKNPKILEYIAKRKIEKPEWFTESIDSILSRNNIDFSKNFNNIPIIV